MTDRLPVRCWTWTFRAEAPDREKTEVQERLATTINRWALANGYILTRVNWELFQNFADGTTTMRADCQFRAIWDGHWGDVRRALEEDGLLPRGDRESRTEPLTLPSGQVWHRPTPPDDPGVGDMWFDTSAAVVVTCYVWTGVAWVTMVGIDPAGWWPGT